MTAFSHRLVAPCLALAILFLAPPAMAEDRVQKIENRVEILDGKVDAKLDAAEKKLDARLDAADRKGDAKLAELRHETQAARDTVAATQKSVDWWIGALSILSGWSAWSRRSFPSLSFANNARNSITACARWNVCWTTPKT